MRKVVKGEAESERREFFFFFFHSFLTFGNPARGDYSYDYLSLNIDGRGLNPSPGASILDYDGRDVFSVDTPRVTSSELSETCRDLIGVKPYILRRG